MKSGLQYRGLLTHRAQCPHTQFERGDYSLWISDVREEDGGVYSCAVDGEGATVVTLRIMKGMKTVLPGRFLIIPNDNSNPPKFPQRSRCVLKCLPHVLNSDRLSSRRCVGE